MKPLRVFIGRDERQPLAANVCASSVTRWSRKRVSIEMVGPDWIPGFTRNGLTTFTFRRYCAPALCDFEGISIFMDGDIVVRADVNELASLAYEQTNAAVLVASHVQRFERPSVMVFNNALCKTLTTEWVNDPQNSPHKLETWAQVGNIPPEWNHCVGYDQHIQDPKLIHWTCGIPCWPETKNSPHAEKWWDEAKFMNSSCSWEELMGNSVHAPLVRSGGLNGKKVAGA